MTTTLPRILVIGAGELGTGVISALSEHHQARNSIVTVLLRPQTVHDPESKQLSKLRAINLSLQFIGIDLVTTSEADLKETFSNYDAVIGCSGYGGSDVQIKLAKATVGSTVKRYIPWQFGAEYDLIGPQAANGLFSEQVDVRAVLRAHDASAQGTSAHTNWTIVSTGIFTSFLFESFYGVVQIPGPNGGDDVVVRALGSWDTKVSTTPAEDIGKLTAEALFDFAIASKAIYIAGDTVSYGQLADLIEKAIKKPVRREEWSLEFLEQEMKREPENLIAQYRLAFGQGIGVAWDWKDTYNFQKGINTTSLEEWIKSHMSVLGQ